MRDLDRRARDLHFDSIVVDGHCDTLGRVVDKGEDISRRTKGQIDLPKMRAGGLDAQFFAFWIEPKHVKAGICVKRSLQMLDALRRVRGLAIATTSSEVRRAAAAGRPAGIPCIECGHAIENDLGVLRIFASLGIRYITLTWNNSTDWADSCAEPPRHGGLTRFGRYVVREMNRTGIIVDVSHVHPKTFWAVLATTRRPVMASHSSARALCDHRRNLHDDQLRAVARNNGVVCVNYYSAFISQEFRTAVSRLKPYPDDGRERKLPRPAFERLIDHIDHIARVAGADHVGLGSDFDGVSSLPEGIDDCSRLPRITRALLHRGYAPRDVRKILGENVLRVMSANEP